MTNQILVNTTLNILQHPGIRKIAFELNGLLVTGARFAEVASAVARGDIKCESVGKFTSRPGTLPPLTVIGARYDPDSNTMLFAGDNYGKINAYEKTVILHEATHAMFDLFAKSNDDRVLGIDDEAAAVLAQALYIRHCEVDDAVHRFTMEINGSGEVALKFADMMIRETQRHNYLGTYFIRPEKIVDFRQAVAKEWGLVKTEDGDRSGILDIYNGVVCGGCRK